MPAGDERVSTHPQKAHAELHASIVDGAFHSSQQIVTLQVSIMRSHIPRIQQISARFVTVDQSVGPDCLRSLNQLFDVPLEISIGIPVDPFQVRSTQLGPQGSGRIVDDGRIFGTHDGTAAENAQPCAEREQELTTSWMHLEPLWICGEGFHTVFTNRGAAGSSAALQEVHDCFSIWLRLTADASIATASPAVTSQSRPIHCAK